MTFYVDIATRRIVYSPKLNKSLNRVEVKRGDIMPISIAFLQNGKAVELDENVEIVFCAKKKGDSEGEPLVLSNTFTLTGGGTSNPKYDGVLGLNSDNLLEYLNNGEVDDDDLIYADLHSEINWSYGDDSFTTSTLILRVYNDVYRDGDGDPLITPGQPFVFPDGLRIPSLTSGNIVLVGADGLLEDISRNGIDTRSSFPPSAHTQAISTITGLSDGTGTIDILNGTVQGTLTANHIHGNLAGNVYTHVRAGENLAKGDPVYVSGSHGSGATLIPIVSKADASNNAKMPAIGIMDTAVTANNNGHMVIVGTITELNTNAYAVNDTLYVASGGGFTSTPPTNNPQPVGRVERSNTNNGAIIVKVNGILTNSITSATTTNFTTGQVIYANGTNVGSLSRSGIDTRASFPNDDVTAATESATPGTLVRRGILNAQIQVEGLESTGAFGAISADQTITTKSSFAFNKSSVFLYLDAAPTVNRTINFPDADGTVALTSDIVDSVTSATTTTFAADSVLASDGTNVKAIETSSGGAGAADGGKIVLYDNAGNVTGNNIFADESFLSQSFKLQNADASFHSEILGNNITANRSVELPDESGTIALTTSNVSTATALQTSRNIFGIAFNGTANVSGDATNAGHFASIPAGGQAGHFITLNGTAPTVIAGRSAWWSDASGNPSFRNGTGTAVTLVRSSDLAANVATFLATPSSANLAAAVTDETGSGSLVFATSPTITTPTIARSGNGTVVTFQDGTGRNAIFETASFGMQMVINATGGTLGAYNTLNGQLESWCNVIANSNTTGLRYMRFGNRTDRFSVQRLNDTGSSITATPFSFANNAPTNSFYMESDGRIGFGTASPNARAIMDLTSTTQGFLPPRMTTTERNAITSVPAGLMLYNTTTNTFDGRNNSSWISLFSSAASSITSASLAGAMTDETGGGSLVFANNPTITSASLDTPSINAPTITNRIDVNGNPVHIRRTGTGIIRESLFNGNPPTGNEDNINGFAIGCRWYMLNGDRYICRDNTTSSAVWKKYPVNIPLAVVEGFSDAANTISADGGILTVRKNSINDVYIANNQICETLDIQSAGSASAINLDTLPLLKNLTINGLSNLTTIDLSNNTDIEVIDLEDVTDLTSFLTSAVTNLTSLSIVNSLNLQLGTLDLGGIPTTKYNLVDVLYIDRIGNASSSEINIACVPNATSISIREITNITFYVGFLDPHPVQTLTVDYCPFVTVLPFDKLTSLISLTWRGRDAMLRQPIVNFYDFDLTLVSTFDNQFSNFASVPTINLPATLTNWNLTGSFLGNSTIAGTPNLTHLTLDNAEVAPTATFDLTTSIAFVNVTHLSAVAATGDFASTGGLTDGMTSLLVLDLSQSSIDVDLTNNTLLTNLTLSSWSGTDLQNLNGNPNTGNLTNLVYLDVSNSAGITNLDITDNILLSELYANGCGLSTSSVDSILLLLDTAGLSNGTLDISGGTNAAPTGGASNTEVLSLQAKGWTITHN